jgi:hypothetical protein
MRLFMGCATPLTVSGFCAGCAFPVTIPIRPANRRGENLHHGRHLVQAARAFDAGFMKPCMITGVKTIKALRFDRPRLTFQQA